MNFTRIGIYYTPAPGAFAQAGADWLGWDVLKGEAIGSPDPKIVGRPQKYGFHGTIKPPFRLAPGTSIDEAKKDMAELAAKLRPVKLDGLEIGRLGPFLALISMGDTAALAHLAGRVVQQLDHLRARATKTELEKRRKPSMTSAELRNIELWGYPHVLESFRFHMTLTGPLKSHQRAKVAQDARDHFEGHLPNPLQINTLTLVGEAEDGMFHAIKRFNLGPQVG